VPVIALRNQCCQWEQDSSDAAADGHRSTVLMLDSWAFAADLLAIIVTTAFAVLFAQALNAQLNWNSSTRSVGDQLLDALTMEVAAAQAELLVPR